MKTLVSKIEKRCESRIVTSCENATMCVKSCTLVICRENLNDSLEKFVKKIVKPCESKMEKSRENATMLAADDVRQKLYILDTLFCNRFHIR